MESHPSLKNIPSFYYKIKKSFKDCLSRQIGEAIAIMLSSDELLNGKCEYLSNTISRVRVDEDDLERKKRESREEAEERERVQAVNEFRVEKEKYLQGTKRKKREVIPIQQAGVLLKKPRLASKYPTNREPDMSETPMSISCCTQNTNKGTLLALEFIPVLAIEYVPTPVTGTPIEMINVPDEPTHTPEPTSHPVRKLKPSQNNYIFKLTGWRAWWDQVLRKESRCEEIPTPGDRKLTKIMSKMRNLRKKKGFL